VSLGKGLQAGFAADEAREAKIADRAFKAEEGIQKRAEEEYKTGISLNRELLKKRLPQLEANPALEYAIANRITLENMSPVARRARGISDEYLRKLQKQTDALMAQLNTTPAAGGKGNPPSDGFGQVVVGKG
jgi:hypothetical protein